MPFMMTIVTTTTVMTMVVTNTTIMTVPLSTMTIKKMMMSGWLWLALRNKLYLELSK